MLFRIIHPYLEQGEQVIVSFEGVDSLPSSFVNTALLPLLHHFSFKTIKESLFFENTNSQINTMIKDRFKSATEKQLIIPVVSEPKQPLA
ncbi:STAS-like domain-containing protein [Pelistega sp. NLN82]|uniref:STAS-like domain-containing protein n=1 Tax=Pelistega ratti TaxID=2652177 RepID=A0A6L9Y531_9BURK|nr:STAS-like domain-containing protein [Pelistega ratti]NEN75582.1 STAS-like domain-containing protein [Pelistega ratti]